MNSLSKYKTVHSAFESAVMDGKAIGDIIHCPMAIIEGSVDGYIQPFFCLITVFDAIKSGYAVKPQGKYSWIATVI